MSTHGIIGPYFFEEPETSNTLTINQERYSHVLSKFWTALLRRVENRRSRQWFQQDGATPHTAKQTLEWIEEQFRGKVISVKTDNPWPQHSPDLSPPDFFLWGYLKDRVYSSKLRSIAELKQNIKSEIKKIDKETGKNVINNFYHQSSGMYECKWWSSRTCPEWLEQDNTAGKQLTFSEVDS